MVHRNNIGGRSIGIACALILLAGCVAGVSPTPSPTSGTGSATAAETGTTTIEVGDRPVLLYVPRTLRPGSRAALVVVLHGYTGKAGEAAEFFGLPTAAERLGVLIAAPQGTTDSEGHTFWNASTACCNFSGSTVDDSTYLSRVITTLSSERPVDPKRVYVVGHSNGGFMAHRFACEHADQVAAIASLAGAMDVDTECAPSRPVSVLEVHGQADDTIRYDGGEINGLPYTSAKQTVAQWRRADGCLGKPRTSERLDADAGVPGKDLTPTTWTGCRDGSEVALWTIADAGHVPTLTAAFTAALFDWLEAHRRRV